MVVVLVYAQDTMSTGSPTPSPASRKADFASRPSAAQSNISAIGEMERDALACRSTGERIGDAIAAHAGRLWFINLHAAWFGGWVSLNCGLPGTHSFDPFPFPFLTLVVSLEAIFLSLFILMSQNRGSKQAEARAHLDLQINLLAEQESTKILQMLQELCAHHRLKAAHDPELDLLTAATEPGTLLQELKDNLTDNS